MRYILALIIALPLLMVAPAWAGEYDGEWLAKGDLSCTGSGSDSFEAVVTILNSQLSGKLEGSRRDYKIRGAINSMGRLDTGVLLSPKLPYTSVLNASGKLSMSKGQISYSSAGPAGANCGGDMILTRTSSKTFTLDVEDDDPLEAKLEKLKKLLEKGLITEEEAAAKRAKLLEDL